ncbi:MAG: glycosyltransferase family 4 protein [Pseudomonadota bacterium]
MARAAMKAHARASFAVPGDLATPTGGYAYAREVIAQANGALTHLALTAALGARPDGDSVTAALGQLAAAPGDRPLLIDGLALGTLPPDGLAALGAPLVGLVHHPLALEHGVPAEDAAWLKANERAALAVCQEVIATSYTTARTLIADYGVAAMRITVAPPGTRRPRPRPARMSVRGDQGGPVKLLSIGSLVPRKGMTTLLDALADVPPNWHLTAIGSTDRDPDHAAALMAKARDLGLDGRITWAGALPRAAVEDALATHDLFVLASRHEGFGMAYAEAMMAGLPVVGCDAGAVAEATGGGACLVPPDDPAALSAALTPLLREPAKRAALAEHGAAAAARLPDWRDTWTRVASALASAGRP